MDSSVLAERAREFSRPQFFSSFSVSEIREKKFGTVDSTGSEISTLQQKYPAFLAILKIYQHCYPTQVIISSLHFDDFNENAKYRMTIAQQFQFE